MTTLHRHFTRRCCLMFPAVAGLLLTTSAGALAQTPASKPAPSALDQIRRDADALLPTVRQPVAKAFLQAAASLPPVTPRQVPRDPVTKRFLSPADIAKLTDEQRKALTSVTIGESFYYNTRYGSPLAYVRPLEILGEAGLKDLAGKRILDFGYGTVGHLRLLALCGANVVGVDVDPLLPALYAASGDQGAVNGTGKLGSVRLVDGQFPADKAVRDAIGGNYDLIISKNTLKNGYLHPSQPVNKELLVHLGVSDADFVRALFTALKPGGKVLIYNLSPAPSKPGEPYKPWADGKTPFPVEMWKAAGFRVVVFDRTDDKAARAMGHTLGWNSGPSAMDLQNDLFTHYTLVEKPKNAQR